MKTPIKRAYWLLFAAEIALYVALLPVFCFVASWESVEPRRAVTQRSPHLHVPENWELVVINHGKVSEWKFGRMSDHPVVAALCISSLIVGVVLALAMRWVRYRLLCKEEKTARGSAGSTDVIQIP